MFVFSGKIVERFPFLRLSPPGDRWGIRGVDDVNRGVGVGDVNPVAASHFLGHGGSQVDQVSTHPFFGASGPEHNAHPRTDAIAVCL